MAAGEHLGRVLYKEEVAEFRYDFDQTDTDNDGYLTGDEIRPMLKLQLEREPTEEECKAMMAEFDIDKDGKITWDEYMTTICGSGWMEDDPQGHKCGSDPQPLTYMVAVDGSKVAELAFQYAARLMTKHDKLIVYHVTNPGRYQEMAPNFHPDTIKANFETLGIRADICVAYDDRVSFVCEEKTDENMKIKEMIRDYADTHADVVVLGSFGAKRAAAGGADFTSIGSTTALVTSGCDAITIVVKQNTTELPAKAQRRFHVAVDGSDISHNAYQEACCFMKKGDFISVLYIETKDSKPGKPIVDAYNADMVQKKIKGAAKAFPAVEGKTISEQILEICEGGSPGDDFGCCDILVMGSNGLSKELPPSGAEMYKEYKEKQRSAHKKGSVSGQCLDGAHCAMLIITVDSLMSGAVKSICFSDWFAERTPRTTAKAGGATG